MRIRNFWVRRPNLPSTWLLCLHFMSNGNSIFFLIRLKARMNIFGSHKKIKFLLNMCIVQHTVVCRDFAIINVKTVTHTKVRGTKGLNRISHTGLYDCCCCGVSLWLMKLTAGLWGTVSHCCQTSLSSSRRVGLLTRRIRTETLGSSSSSSGGPSPF